MKPGGAEQRDPGASAEACAKIAIEAISTGLVFTDEDGRVLFANARAAEILGRSTEELRSLKIDVIIDQIDAITEAQLRGSKDTRREVTIRLRDGTERVLGLSTAPAPRDADGDPAGRIVWFEDVTQYVRLRKERDRLLQRAIVAELLPSILHQLRNPLASITNAVELLLEEATEESVLQDLRAVLREAQRMDLGFQGFAIAGRDIRSHQKQDIAEAVRGAATALEPHVVAAGSELVVEIEPLPTLRLNPGVVRGLVFNLVSHALGRGRGTRLRLWCAIRDGRSFNLGIASPGARSDQEPRDLNSSTELVGGRYVELLLCKRAAEAAGGGIVMESSPELVELVVALPVDLT